MTAPLDEVDTIVVVMMENRSFDHVLGFLSHESFDARTDVDGLHQHSDRFDWDNPDDEGRLYGPTATPDSYVPGDMPHGRKQIAAQIDGGSMLGFMKSYLAFQNSDRGPVPMRFCRPEDIPVTAALARRYAVCDRWFASLPDDTFPNRLMSLCGTTRIDDTGVLKPTKGQLLPDQQTVFDWLDKKELPYRIYVDAAPLANVGPPASMLVMKSQWRNVVTHAHTLTQLATDWQSDDPAPAVIYCEPFFNDFAIAIGKHGNCNHPPLPMSYGEQFLKTVYTTLTSNPAKWARTLMILCYDEHGGFFDHVPPPRMHYEAPDGHRWLDRSPFETLGVRIPAIIASPLVEPGSVCHELFDHTSILQLIVDKFGSPDDLAYFGDAPNRKANGIKSLAVTVTGRTRAPDVQVPDPPPAMGPATTPPISDIAVLFRRAIAMNPKTVVENE